MPWEEALLHISDKLGWDGDDVQIKTMQPTDLNTIGDGSDDHLDILMLVDLKDSSFEVVKQQGKRVMEKCKVVKAFDSHSCFKQLEKFGEYNR